MKRHLVGVSLSPEEVELLQAEQRSSRGRVPSLASLVRRAVRERYRLDGEPPVMSIVAGSPVRA